MNKAQGSLTIYRDIKELGFETDTENIVDLAKTMPVKSMLMYQKLNSAYVGAPYPYKWGYLIIDKAGSGRINCEYWVWGAGVSVTRWQGAVNLLDGLDTFTGWEKVSTAKPVSRYNLPATNSFTRAVYRQDDFAQTTVTLGISRSAETPVGEIVVGQLPVGYRPADTVCGAGIVASTGQSILIRVSSNGEVAVALYTPVEAGQELVGSVSFVAADV